MTRLRDSAAWFGCLLCFSTSVTWPVAQGQTLGTRYRELKEVLNLSDLQLEQIHSPPSQLPAGGRRASGPATPADGAGFSNTAFILDEDQRNKLSEISKIFAYEHPYDGSLAIELGLLKAEEWPPGVYCRYPIRGYWGAAQFSPEQIARFEELQRIAKEPARAKTNAEYQRRSALLSLGAKADSEEVKASEEEIARLQTLEFKAKPDHDLALAILKEEQRQRFDSFKSALQLAMQAVDLGLLLRPGTPEVLCH